MNRNGIENNVRPLITSVDCDAASEMPPLLNCRSASSRICCDSPSVVATLAKITQNSNNGRAFARHLIPTNTGTANRLTRMAVRCHASPAPIERAA